MKTLTTITTFLSSVLLSTDTPEGWICLVTVGLCLAAAFVSVCGE